METEVRNKDPSIPMEKVHLQSPQASRMSCIAVQEVEREANRLDIADGKSLSTTDPLHSKKGNIEKIEIEARPT
jgi:hypothetical protein